jgi:choline kinase
MKGIILAAGRGSRMASLSDERPKCLLEVGGEPLIDRQIKALRDGGIADIGIVTGYRRESLTNRRLVEFYNPRWSKTNMVFSLSQAKDWLCSSPCLISYSDIFYSSEAVVSLMKSSAKLAITYDPNWLSLWQKRFGNPLEDAETFRVNSCFILQEIGGKAKAIEDIQGQYMGLIRMTPEAWCEITDLREGMQGANSDSMDMTSTLQKVISRGKIEIEAIPYQGVWGEIDTESDLKVYSDAPI